MGIKQLSRLILSHAPKAVSQHEIKNYFNRVLAVDASMCLYQFLISIRTGTLTNNVGSDTSHISGMFYRTIKLLENGIKPVFVFDGKAPKIKSDTLKTRKENRETAVEKLKEAVKQDDKKEMEKQQKRIVRVTKQENDDTKTLLRLMGVPVVEAPGEAEAQCAEMCKGKIVYGVATEDMDTLTFGSPILVRNALKSSNKNDPIVEYNLESILEEMEVDMDQFIDICILCGCDYTKSLKGIGPNKAYTNIKKYTSIEKFIESSYKEDTQNFLYKEARSVFKSPEIIKSSEIKLEWKAPDKEGLIRFLVEKNGFNMERVQSGIARILKAKKKGSQTRLDNFFTTERKVLSGEKRKTIGINKSIKKAKN